MSYEVNSLRYKKEIHSFEMDFLKAEHLHVYKASRQIEAYASNWCLGIANIPKGVCEIRSRDQWIPLVGDVAVFIPAFSIVEFHILCESQIKWISIMSTSSLPFDIGNAPFLLSQRLDVPINKIETYRAIDFILKTGMKIEQEKSSNHISEKAKNYIDKHFRENLKITDISSVLNVSRVVLSRSFTSNYGISLTEYRHRLRLFEALSYLNKGYSITEALVAVGFADSSQFNLQFKKYFKIPPHKYAFFKQQENKRLLQDLSGI